MVLTHMMVNKELNPLGWFLGLPLLVGAAWVWVHVAYGETAGYFVLAAGVADIAIGFWPLIAESKRRASLLRKIEDGTAAKMGDSQAKRELEESVIKTQDEKQKYNNGVRNWWFKDLLDAHPNSAHTFTVEEDRQLLYCGFPLQTMDNRILVVQRDRIAVLDHAENAGQRLKEASYTQDSANPVDADILLKNLGAPQLRIDVSAHPQRSTPIDHFYEHELTLLSEGDFSQREIWVYKSLFNNNEHGITVSMRNKWIDGKEKPLPTDGMTSRQVAARDFMLNVGYRKHRGTNPVGLFYWYNAVAIIVTRKSTDGPASIDPGADMVPILNDQTTVLNQTSSSGIVKR